MDSVLAAFFAKLGELYLALYELFILACVVVCALANRTAQLDEVFTEFGICHENLVKFSPHEMPPRLSLRGVFNLTKIAQNN